MLSIPMGNTEKTTLFDAAYERRKQPLLSETLKRLRPIYSQAELNVLRIDSTSREVLSQRSGRGVRQSRYFGDGAWQLVGVYCTRFA